MTNWYRWVQTIYYINGYCFWFRWLIWKPSNSKTFLVTAYSSGNPMIASCVILSSASILFWAHRNQILTDIIWQSPFGKQKALLEDPIEKLLNQCIALSKFKIAFKFLGKLCAFFGQNSYCLQFNLFENKNSISVLLIYLKSQQNPLNFLGKNISEIFFITANHRPPKLTTWNFHEKYGWRCRVTKMWYIRVCKIIQ